MADETLEIIITATDNASRVISGIGDGFKGLGNLGTKALLGIGAAAAGALAGAGVALGAFTVQAVNSASDLNESINAATVVFGDAVGQIEEFAAVSADQAGLSAAAWFQMSAQTGAMLQNFGLDLYDAATASEQLAVRAADMASIFNTDVNDALTAIMAGLRGEADPLERFGVSLTAAAVNAKAMEMGLADANGELTQAALTQARLALLFEQTDALAGDFVNTSDQLANAARVNAARWENFRAEVGTNFLPIVQTFQGVLMEVGEIVFPLVSEAVANFAPRLQEAAEGLGNIIVALFDAGAGSIEFREALSGLFGEEVAAQIQNAIFWITDLKDTFVTFVTETVIPFITEHQEGIKAAFIAIGAAIIAAGIVSAIAAIANPVTLLIAVIGLLAAAWAEDWGGIRTALTEFWNTTAQPILQNLWNWLSVNVPQAIATLKNFWENVLLPAMQNFWGWVQSTVFPIIQALWDWLATNVPIAIQTLSDFWTNTLLPAVTLVWEFVNNSIVPLFTALWDLLSVAGSLALTALTGLWQNVLLPALTAVWDFIMQSLQPVFTALSDFITNTIGPAIASFAGSDFLGALKTALDNIATAISNVIGWIQSMITKLGEVTLPDWLTPGSPTPFEIGLHGIRKELEMLSMNTLPGFSAALNIGGGPGGDTVSNNYNLTINTSAPTEPILDDFAMLQALAG